MQSRRMVAGLAFVATLALGGCTETPGDLPECVGPGSTCPSEDAGSEDAGSPDAGLDAHADAAGDSGTEARADATAADGAADAGGE